MLPSQGIISAVIIGGCLIIGGCDRSAAPPAADVPAAEGAGMSLDVAALETTSTMPAPTALPDEPTTGPDTTQTSPSSAAPVF